MAATITNTDANINAKTVMATENAETVTGLKTFDRDPNPPFAVSAGSAVVPNLIAERSTYASGPYQGQFAFPASQNASADANTLDDYEEGTWTPAIKGTTSQSGQVYSIQSGTYVKIGKRVFVQGRITLSTLGTVTGSVEIGELPFTADSTANNYSTLHIPYWVNLTTAVVHLSAYITPNTTRAHLSFATAAAASSSVTMQQADLSNTTDLIFSGHYLASA